MARRSGFLIHMTLFLSLLTALSSGGCGKPPPSYVGQGGRFDSPVAAVANGRYVYVMSGNFDLSKNAKGAITVIDVPASLENRIDCVTTRIETPPYIGRMVLSPDRRTGYLANRDGDDVLLLDLSEPSAPRITDLDPAEPGTQGIPVGIEPFGLALSPDGLTLYVANVGSGDLSIVDLAQGALVKNELLNWGINDVKIQPGNHYAYVTNRGLNAVALIDTDTNRVIGSDAPRNLRTGVGMDSRGLDFTPDGKWAFIAARNPDSLLVVDTSKIPSHPESAVLDILPLDLKPSAVKVTPDGKEVWVTNFTSNNVYAFDVRSRAVLEVITVGAGPYDIAMSDEDPDDPGHYYVYVPNFLSHSVSLIDSRTKEYIWVLP